MPSRNGYIPYDTGSHSPGVIAIIDTHDAHGHVVRREYEGRVFDESFKFPTYEAAANWCRTQIALRAEAELEPRIGCSCNLCSRKLSSPGGVTFIDAGVPSLADELA